MKDYYYKLDKDHNVIACDSIEDVKEFWSDKDGSNRRVAETTVGRFWVSTVFLVINHRFGDEGPPIVFETMIFSKDSSLKEPYGLEEQYCDRYSTWDEAVEGHAKAVAYAEKLEEEAKEAERAIGQ